MRIGLISDTHNRLDRAVEEGLAGVSHILHAGDVCDPALIAQLEAIAPVTVALGNNDDFPGWRTTEVIELGGVRLLVEHIVDPHRPRPEFRACLKKVRPDVVVFGHTHRPFLETVDGILYVNPGSAGSPRFGLGRSYGLVEIDPERRLAIPRILELPRT